MPLLSWGDKIIELELPTTVRLPFGINKSFVIKSPLTIGVVVPINSVLDLVPGAPIEFPITILLLKEDEALYKLL